MTSGNLRMHLASLHSLGCSRTISVLKAACFRSSWEMLEFLAIDLQEKINQKLNYKVANQVLMKYIAQKGNRFGYASILEYVLSVFTVILFNLPRNAIKQNEISQNLYLQECDLFHHLIQYVVVTRTYFMQLTSAQASTDGKG